MFWIHRSKCALSTVFILFIMQVPVEAQVSEKKLNARPSLPDTLNVRDLPEIDAASRIAEYESLVKEYPDDAIVHNNLGAQYALQKRFAEAAASIEKAIRLNSKLSQIHVNLAIVYNGLSRHDDALAAVLKALELSPEDVKAKNLRCDLYTLKERHDEAVICYEKLLKATRPDNISIGNYGYALLNSGRVGRAIEILETAAAASPNDVALLNGLGMALYKKKKYEPCVATFKRALELAPNRAEIRFNLAIAQVANRNRAAALRQYNFLKDSDPDLAKKVYRMLYRDKLVFVDALKR